MKTYTQLGITFAEYGALLGLREMLANGTIANTPSHEGPIFDMNLTMDMEGSKHCGTIGCIGGYMALIMGHSIADADEYVRWGCSSPLKHLFYPTIDSYSDITPEIAVEAIDSFLDGKAYDWRPARHDDY